METSAPGDELSAPRLAMRSVLLSIPRLYRNHATPRRRRRPSYLGTRDTTLSVRADRIRFGQAGSLLMNEPQGVSPGLRPKRWFALLAGDLGSLLIIAALIFVASRWVAPSSQIAPPQPEGSVPEEIKGMTSGEIVPFTSRIRVGPSPSMRTTRDGFMATANTISWSTSRERRST